MLAFIPTNRLGRSEILRAWRLSLSLLLTWAGVQAMHAQTGGGLGCVIDAGISPQEVCKGDHVVLGGNPTIPYNLSQEYASVLWSVLEGDSVAFDPSPYVPNPLIAAEWRLCATDGRLTVDRVQLVQLTLSQPHLLPGACNSCFSAWILARKRNVSMVF